MIKRRNSKKKRSAVKKSTSTTTAHQSERNGKAASGELKACGILVYREQPRRQFLLMKHPKRWDIPKGHIDPGESELECALRELVEETGIVEADIELNPGFRFEIQYPVSNKRTGGELWDKTVIVFLARLAREVKIKVTEHESYEWFDWEAGQKIQPQTIDPLLDSLATFWRENPRF